MRSSTRGSALTDTLATAAVARKAPRWRRRLARNPLAILGAAIIAFFLLIVAFAPFIAPYSPLQQDLRTAYLPPGTGGSWGGPDGQSGMWARQARGVPAVRD